MLDHRLPQKTIASPQVQSVAWDVPLTPEEQAVYRACAERSRQLHKVLLEMNGGRQYPDSTPLIREMRDNPRL